MYCLIWAGRSAKARVARDVDALVLDFRQGHGELVPGGSQGATSRGRYLMGRKLCPCGCGDEVPPSRGTRERIYAKRYACYVRARRREASFKLQRNKRTKVHRTATLGRECRWCRRVDGPSVGGVLWTGRRDECARCSRQRLRSSCSNCGGPFYKVAQKDRDVGCAACYELTEYDRLVLRSKRDDPKRR